MGMLLTLSSPVLFLYGNGISSHLHRINATIDHLKANRVTLPSTMISARAVMDGLGVRLVFHLSLEADHLVWAKKVYEVEAAMTHSL